MSRKMPDWSWSKRLLIVALWILGTAGISWFVASRTDSSGDHAQRASIAPPVTEEMRQLVSLKKQTIQPFISGNGTVIEGDDGFALEAVVDDDDLAYRLLDEPQGVKALISGGPAGFDCAWLGLGENPDGRVSMRCAIPDDIRVAPGMRGTMALEMGPPAAVTALPVTAVVGTVDRGEVIVVHPDGSTEVRPVELGVSDVFWVEIVSGLSPDEQVLQNPVQSDFFRTSQ